MNSRKEIELIRQSLEQERSTFLSHWDDLSEYILPRRSRFTTSDTNKGDRRHYHIINSTGTFASRTLASGLMSGVTSPARPWFKLETPDPDLNEFGAVKYWLHFVTNTMRTVFLRSNLYNVLPTVYGDMGTFATGTMYMERDPDTIVRFSSWPIGSYSLGTDERGRVRIAYRDFAMTVRNVVQKFAMVDGNPDKIDWSNVSSHVKSMWESKTLDKFVEVCHVIRPNPKFNPNRASSKFKKFQSIYYETGGHANKQVASHVYDDDKFLREGGYDYFPILAPRWEVTGEDIYGTNSPGMMALGDIRALQTMELRKSQALEKKVNPPVNVPTEAVNQKISLLPGAINYVDGSKGNLGVRSAYDVQFQLNELMADIQEHQRRISRAYYEDLFLMLAQSDRRQITAREIDERHEEKLLALGPVLEQINQDLLDPLIDNTFMEMQNAGIIPEPPDELKGMDLKVEYISIMAQAQRLIGISGMNNFQQSVTGLLQANPESLDKINTDQFIDEYADLMGLPPGVIRTDEEVQQMREQRAQAQQAQAQMEALQQGAGVAKDLGQADAANIKELLGG